ncbi:MAG: class I SAM-dependent methyltransferase [Kineosporiaceae bacterium]
MGQDAGWDLARFHDVDGALDPDALIGFLDSAKGHPVLADLQERLIAELRPAPGDRVLDAGCGPGTQALEIAQRVAGARVTGVDSSQLMIDEAQRRARDSGLDVSFQVADAGALPFPDATFAACHAQTLMEHVTDPA